MTPRRTFLKHLSVAAGVASLGLGPLRLAMAADDRWFMPEEDQAQQRIFLAYAADETVWEDQADDVNDCIAKLARTIAKYQPVTVLCHPEDLDVAREECGTDNTEFLAVALDDIWIRDYGGCFVIDDDGKRALMDFNFNGWGNKQRHRNDNRVAKKLANALAIPYLQSELTGEGGGIEVDGHGTAIITESCWVNANRNPDWSRADVEAELKANLGLRKIIWLPGIKGRDITDAHVDFYARFVEPGVVIANLDNDPDSYDYEVTRKHLEILKQATDADGRPFTVHLLPPPRTPRSNRFTRDNPDFAAGYINYLPINGAVIAPQFGDAQADAYCKQLLAKLYPGRTIEQVNIDAIAAGGGGIHCVSKNMPA
ncbi:agmatine deiminase family protein [Pseudomonas tructae]|uniref:Agmatine deiminase family protein n=1 Tax=Pseudomonas tructae TaxID=2518644 RepID=A0A411MHD9_9PSED|nr:agmatine deiminase family protein [Pseudomonas tructae]QBF26255.1 agmatine deiminase family protein [Pseudomonas tructae]